ncbi:MAG: hypothetical protein CMI09_09085 [Oceanospirillaceae bacterium]|nr:hypothetical protein [Oceanospirillaceae bacterium]|tara:strand:+ start:181 stop:1116 length:936 start_codon:yes stop_codon:yes gene_type:complete
MSIELIDLTLGFALALWWSAWFSSAISLWLLKQAQPVTSNSHDSVTLHQRENLIWSCALLPWGVGLLSAWLLVNPQSFWFLPHCHGDVCEVHAPELASTSAIASTSLVILALLLISIALRRLWRLHHQRQQLRLMQQLSTLDTRRDVRVIPSTNRLAWCAGLWRPVIYLSQGLLDELSERERQLVLIHEHSHRWRRDNLRRWCLQWLLWCWWPDARRRVVVDYHRLTEQIADAMVLQQGFEPQELIELRHRISTDVAEPVPSSVRNQTSGTADQSDPKSQRIMALLAVLALTQVSLFSVLLHPLLDHLFLF